MPKNVSALGNLDASNRDASLAYARGDATTFTKVDTNCGNSESASFEKSATLISRCLNHDLNVFMTNSANLSPSNEFVTNEWRL